MRLATRNIRVGLLLIGIAVPFIFLTSRNGPCEKIEEKSVSATRIIGGQQQGLLNGSVPLPSFAAPRLPQPGQAGVRQHFDDLFIPMGEDNLDTDTAIQRLIPGLVPTIVHFVWCTKQDIFRFNHYLTVLSAIRALEANEVILHYGHNPAHDTKEYNQWLKELQRGFSRFVMRRIYDDTSRLCDKSLQVQRDAIVDLLRKDGGIYIGKNTWLVDIPASRLKADLEYALEPESMEGFIILRKDIAKKGQSLDDLIRNLTKHDYNVTKTRCNVVQDVVNGLISQPSCLIVNGKSHEKILPKDIMDKQDVLSSIARRIFYGSSEIPKPKPSPGSLVPNIAHIVWWGHRRIDYLLYLNVLSLLFVVEVDKVFVHGDCEPRGIYWKKLKDNPKVNPRLVCLQQPRPQVFYQNEYDPRKWSLLSDFMRAEIMVKYGGFYSDVDAVWVKPFTKEERQYDAVATFHVGPWHRPFPAEINLGVSYCKRNAPFFQHLRYKMREDFSHLSSWTSTMMPYKIWERYPSTLRIDSHLQVMCYQGKCRPTWMPGFQNNSLDYTLTGALDNWREDVHAFHWTSPNPPAFANESALRAGKGIFADAGRMILSKSGLL